MPAQKKKVTKKETVSAVKATKKKEEKPAPAATKKQSKPAAASTVAKKNQTESKQKAAPALSCTACRLNMAKYPFCGRTGKEHQTNKAQ